MKQPETLVFATNNPHKLGEIQSALQSLGAPFKVLGLADLGFREDIPETADTLEGNALQKAAFVRDRFGISCFADDTGLEIEALGNRPGVYSARYAGEACSFDDNIDKILAELQGVSHRHARFRTVICLILQGQIHYFEGQVPGIILEKRQGSQGFGYDPVFQPDAYQMSFAEMSLTEKNHISHRGRAVRDMLAFLGGHR